MLTETLSVVIPCYKEAEVIEANVAEVFVYLKPRFSQFEIIVVTDGSPDGTADRIRSLKEKRADIPLIHISFQRNQGKGAAVKAGVLASRYETILTIDADLTIPIEELEDFIAALKSSDLVIGSRLVSGTRFEEPAPWYRIVMARSFHILQLIFLANFEFSDTQCGFKLYRRNAALPLFQKATVKRFAFDAEILFIAKKKNLKVAVLPVLIKKDPRNTNVNILLDPLNMLFAVLKIRWNDWEGKYD